MTRFQDEDVIAYVDDRMVDEMREPFERALRVDKALADRVAAHRWMTRQIAAAFGPPPDVGVDDPLVAWLDPDRGKVISLAGRRRPAVRRSFLVAVLSGAMAASLVCGVLIGRTMSGTDSLLRLDQNGKLAARGMLADGLSNRLAGEEGPVRIGISFHTAHEVCRTFSTIGGTSGLACRHGAEWSLPVVANPDPDSHGSGEYRLAGDAVTPDVMAQVDRRIVGSVLSTKEEAEFKARGWR